MITSINLPNDRFEESVLKDIKAKNFIYGKNGTGKTSISHAILEQYKHEYDIHLFEGFNSVVSDNHILNAISLGTQNASVQPLIEEAQEELDKINSDLNTPEEGTNTFSALKLASDKYEKQKKLIKKFYVRSASILKNSYQDIVCNVNYNKNNFIDDVENAQKLSSNDILLCKKTISQKTLPSVKKITFPSIDSEKYLQNVNALLQKEVTKSVVINFESDEQQKWVEKGTNLHINEDGSYKKRCIFCGNLLSKERIDNLNNYFNDVVKELELKINKIEKELSQEKDYINGINPLKKSDFYDTFFQKVDSVNLKIEKAKNNYNNFFEDLIDNVNRKKDHIFAVIDPLNSSILDSLVSWKSLQKECQDLIEKNNDYGKSFDKNIAQAKNRLLKHQVALAMDKFNYNQEKNKLHNLLDSKNTCDHNFKKKIKEKTDKEKEISHLKEQSVDESLAANNINKKLMQLGNQSFKLIEVKDSDQKGQYIVQGLDGQTRSIDKLSTGEKNIVAFLWFINNLENTRNEKSKSKIIIFDDPMTSNDDTCQYLIITELQNIINKTNDDQIFILTHNIHFYLNVRFGWWKGASKPTYNKTTFYLYKTEGKTKVEKITNENNDLKNSYDELWNELKWLYDNHKPNLLLNPIRRIFETYCKFNNLNLTKLYESNPQARKYFNVNSHDIDDPGTDPNGKNEEDIMKEVADIFKSIGGEQHFKARWIIK